MKANKQKYFFRILACCIASIVLPLHSGIVNADGTEALGTPSVAIASGTAIEAAGVGLAESQPGNIDFTVPAGADVAQVLLYWEGYTIPPSDGDAEILVNGADVTGVLIGGPTQLEGTDISSSAYRADITDLGLVVTGPNSLSISGLDFDINHGAGILVVLDDGSDEAVIGIRDGNDFAFFPFASPQDTTVAQTFNFLASPQERSATLKLHFASVAGTASSGGEAGVFRPSAIEVTIGGAITVYDNLLDSVDGQEWDSVSLELTVPAGETSVTVQALSVDNGAPIPDGTTRGGPASFHWLAAALAISPPPPLDGPTRTLGYWKNHPTVINGEFGGAPSLLPLSFCGERIEQDEVCEAVGFLSEKGGGLGNFKRQGMAALLNCEAFGCPSDIHSLVMEGSDACAASDASYDFGAAGEDLDKFNNSRDDVDLPFHSPSAQPKYCSSDADAIASKGKKGNKGKKGKKGKKDKKGKKGKKGKK